MEPTMKLNKKLMCAAVILGSCLSMSVQATIVEFKTSLGTFEVNLFDETTPETVANFLKYVEAESYNNSVIHRMVPDFVVQGGGFAYTGALPLRAIPALPAVKNEPKWSNRRGTIAMAKIGGLPDSATNQWFFNLKDNHASTSTSVGLDAQNGGFTVFGQVSAQGLEILDEIAKLKRFNMGGAADTIPLRNYTAADAAASKLVTDDNFVMIESITVVDARPDTAASLSPIANTTPPEVPSEETDSGSKSGSMQWWVALLLPLALMRRFNRKVKR